MKNFDFNEFEGIGSLNTIPNSNKDGKYPYTYLTIGNKYVRYSDASGSIIDEGYPKPIVPNWGFTDAAGSFADKFDSMATLPNGKTYVTSGPHYIRYSDISCSKMDKGFPKPIGNQWGDIDQEFKNGFDAMATLYDNHTYVFKNNMYYRYSDDSATTVDKGYPKNLTDNWEGVDLPELFSLGIDAISKLPNGKVYMIRGVQYIRLSYSDGKYTIDEGFPKIVEKYWGFEKILSELL